MINYDLRLSFNSEEDISFMEIKRRVLSQFPDAEAPFIYAVHAEENIFTKGRPVIPDPTVPVPADHADPGLSEAVSAPGPVSPAVQDANVVDDGSAKDHSGSTTAVIVPDEVTKEMLKDKLFELRDAKGSDAVKEAYAACGQGAKTLKTLDESCYVEMYRRVVSMLAE